MNTLDPSYLRYIYDSILSGEVSPENESSLPDGLVGLYEENFPEGMPAAKRQRLLTIFAQWALLRKEVTVEFMAEITATPVDEIRELIGAFSSWFNSPETGKYMLFHERIRSYFLQKLPEGELKALNERLIARLQKAIEVQLKDEFELYALQFLSDHLVIEAFADVEKGKELLAFNKNESNWNRQIRLSNQFKWTENSIKNSILWTAKFQPEETVMCYLDMVELHYKEKNDAENIVALVANDEMEMALKRIDSFAGNDKEGLQRKFTLYMLCLMELTLLDSKDKPFRKSAIENLLKHLDEKIPANQYDLINWNDFFPSYLMFKMACVWAELELDYGVVYRRTDDWEKEWIKEKGAYSDFQFQVLKEAAFCIIDKLRKSRALREISIELAKQIKIEEALSYALGIRYERDKNSALLYISIELAKQGKFEEALECSRYIGFYYISRALQTISSELAKHGRLEEAESTMQDALACARGISDEEDKSSALQSISSELFKQGKFETSASAMQEALACARGIIDERDKSSALRSISSELAEQGKVEEAASAMQEALSCARGMSSESYKSSALESISSELAKQGKLEEALACARGVSDMEDKSSALQSISSELAKQGKIEEAASAMKEALACARGINDETHKSKVIAFISSELAKQGKEEEAGSVMNEALACARGIIDESDKSGTIRFISSELAEQGKFKEAVYAMQAALLFARGKRDKSSALQSISNELARQGKVEEAFACVRGIDDERDKCIALQSISRELAKQGKVEEAASALQEAIVSARVISVDWKKSSVFVQISNELAKQGKVEEALSVARGISNDRYKSIALQSISSVLVKYGKVEEAASALQEAFACIQSISSKSDKSRALQNYSSEMAKQVRVEEAFACVRGIVDESDKSSALQSISIELAKQGKVDEALACARGISDEDVKSLALASISSELAKQGKVEEAASAMQEALTCARGISVDWKKSSVLVPISSELAKQGKIEESASAMQEALAFARGISSESSKSRRLQSISIEFSNQANYPLSEQSALEIPQIADRHNCWKQIAQTLKELHGWEKALELLEEFKNEEARSFYLKGWAESITLEDMSEELIQKALPALVGDRDSIEELLQLYAIHQLFFEAPSKERIARYNKTLNIQWALDIKAQFPQDGLVERRSDNLEEWIGEIGDEEMRNMVISMPNMIKMGFLTEAEFREKVKGL